MIRARMCASNYKFLDQSSHRLFSHEFFEMHCDLKLSAEDFFVYLKLELKPVLEHTVVSEINNTGSYSWY